MNGEHSWTKESLTERSNPLSADLEHMSALEIVTLMNSEDLKVVQAVERALPSVASLVDEAVERMRAGGRLFYVGAGTSGRLGVLDAAECPPTFGTPPELVQALIAGGERAFVKAVENAEDSRERGASDLRERALTSHDFVVGISASGRTPYVLGALGYAATQGAGTASIYCNPGAALSRAASHPVELAVGPEILTGSTRLKAGTATKMVLNMISTALMVRLGHCCGNLMVDVAATNSKLVDRQHRILAESCGISLEEAARVLTSVEGNMREAIRILQEKRG